MNISISVKLIGSLDELKRSEKELALADISINSLPVSNRYLRGKQIETLIWEQYQSALRLAVGGEMSDGILVKFTDD